MRRALVLLFPLLLAAGPSGKSPEEGVKVYLAAHGDWEDQTQVSCIQKSGDTQALCEARGFTYVCYDQSPSGCGTIREWSCIPLDPDMKVQP